MKETKYNFNQYFRTYYNNNYIGHSFFSFIRTLFYKLKLSFLIYLLENDYNIINQIHIGINGKMD